MVLLEISKYSNMLRLPEQIAQGYVQSSLRLLSFSGQLLPSLVTLTEKDYFLQHRNSSSVSPNIFADHQQCLLALKKEIIVSFDNCSIGIDDHSQWEPDLRHAAMLMCKHQVAKNPIFSKKKQTKSLGKQKNVQKKNPRKSKRKLQEHLSMLTELQRFPEHYNMNMKILFSFLFF